MRTYDAETKAKVLELYAAGKTGIEISADLDIPAPTVYGWISLAGIGRGRSGHLAYGEEAKARALELYGLNVPYVFITQEIGCSEKTVRNWLEEAGVPRDRLYTKEQIAAAIALYQKGHSAEKVARKIGCDESTVYIWLERAGVPRRPRSSWRAYGDWHLENVLKLRRKGYTWSETERRLKMSQSTAKRLLARRGVADPQST